MFDLSVERALALADEFFPHAPEKIVQQYGIEVRRSPLACDGWCLQLDDRAIIRINSATTLARQRFTLAHELGHLILGIPAVIGESMFIIDSKRSVNEREVNKLAAKILLPASRIRDEIREVPITAAVIEKLAKRARVSDSAVALRLADEAPSFGLTNAAVVFYSNDRMVWQFSEKLWLSDDGPDEVLAECKKAFPMAARIPQGNNEVVVASFVDNPKLDTKTVFLQLVPDHEGLKQLRVERLKELEKELFAGDGTFRSSVNGRFGHFRPAAMKLQLEEAVEQFTTRLRTNPPNLLNPRQLKALLSPKGSEYIRLKLQQWTKD